MTDDRLRDALELLAWSARLEEERVSYADFLDSVYNDREGTDGAEYLDTVNAG